MFVNTDKTVLPVTVAVMIRDDGARSEGGPTPRPLTTTSSSCSNILKKKHHITVVNIITKYVQNQT